MGVIDNTDNPATGGENPETTETENEIINEEIDVCKQILENIVLELKKISQFLGA